MLMDKLKDTENKLTESEQERKRAMKILEENTLMKAKMEGL